MQQITSKINWGVAALFFVGEFGFLSYQYGTKKIDYDTYKRRVKSSICSNVANVVGGSIGAAIGNIVGNLICPGFGGYLGTIIGGILGSITSSIATDMFFDPQSYSMKKYEEIEVTEEQKEQLYL